jgi:signal peptidase I
LGVAVKNLLSKISKKARREILTIALLALCILSARSTLADHYVVPTGSMKPTVEIKDRVFVNKLAYGLHIPFFRPYLIDFDGPHREDVVVLDSPVDEVTLLKRVVAEPGDLVSVTAGKISIGGKELEHNHQILITKDGGQDLPEQRVPEGHYLVMGDNRGESFDGRYFGFVERDRIRGKAIAVYWSDGGFAWRKL